MSGLSNSALVVVGILALSTFGSAQQAPPAHTATLAGDLGYAENSRMLVIEAEDLGMAHSIDKASFEALEKGWVTSAGVLVPAPWFPEVVRWARNHPNADLGVQADLNAEWASYRWRPVSIQPATSGLLDPAGYLANNARYIAQHVAAPIPRLPPVTNAILLANITRKSPNAMLHDSNIGPANVSLFGWTWLRRIAKLHLIGRRCRMSLCA